MILEKTYEMKEFYKHQEYRMRQINYYLRRGAFKDAKEYLNLLKKTVNGKQSRLKAQMDLYELLIENNISLSSIDSLLKRKRK